MAQTVHLLIMYTMLVLTLLLFHKGRKHPQSLMLAIYASVEVLTNGLNSLTLSSGNIFFDRFPFSHFIYKPIYCLWVPLFYFYFRSNLSPDFRITKKHWPHFLPSALFLISFLSIWVFNGNHYLWENLYNEGSLVYNAAFAVDATVKIQYLIYNRWSGRSGGTSRATRRTRASTSTPSASRRSPRSTTATSRTRRTTPPTTPPARRGVPRRSRGGA